jgi:hypothetical protein
MYKKYSGNLKGIAHLEVPDICLDRKMILK